MFADSAGSVAGLESHAARLRVAARQYRAQASRSPHNPAADPPMSHASLGEFYDATTTGSTINISTGTHKLLLVRSRNCTPGTE